MPSASSSRSYSILIGHIGMKSSMSGSSNKDLAHGGFEYFIAGEFYVDFETFLMIESSYGTYKETAFVLIGYVYKSPYPRFAYAGCPRTGLSYKNLGSNYF